jgi:glyoxylase-like metal-dependent hydrolase (beta-lactamase superfamily II)
MIEPVEFVENQVIEVGPGVWMRVAIDNISWADMGNGAAVIDALEDPSQADVVRDLITQTSGQDLKWIVQTHWDADHIACNPQWKREGAIAIAHQSCAAAAGEWEGRPDISYSDEAVLQGEGERRIEMKWWGGTHTPWDTILYFPHAKVLHIADLFGWGLIPCEPTPQKINRLREIYDAILRYEANVVLCGHGPVLTLAHIERMREYLEGLLDVVPALLAQGKNVAEIARQVLPPDDMRHWWRFVDWKHEHNIKLIQEAQTKKVK